VRLHTTTQKREQEVGVIPLADMVGTLYRQNVGPLTCTFTCPSACLDQMVAPVTILFIRAARASHGAHGA